MNGACWCCGVQRGGMEWNGKDGHGLMVDRCIALGGASDVKHGKRLPAT